MGNSQPSKKEKLIIAYKRKRYAKQVELFSLNNEITELKHKLDSHKNTLVPYEIENMVDQLLILDQQKKTIEESMNQYTTLITTCENLEQQELIVDIMTDFKSTMKTTQDNAYLVDEFKTQIQTIQKTETQKQPKETTVVSEEQITLKKQLMAKYIPSVPNVPEAPNALTGDECLNERLYALQHPIRIPTNKPIPMK
jgi:hypothetical protein